MIDTLVAVGAVLAIVFYIVLAAVALGLIVDGITADPPRWL